MYTGDPTRIRQLMAIFLDNAFKYGRSGGEVAVRLRQGGTPVSSRCIIRTGDLPGGPAPYLRTVLPLRQRPGRNRDSWGWPLPSPLCQNCRGTLTAESEYGVWTRFRVTL